MRSISLLFIYTVLMSLFVSCGRENNPSQDNPSEVYFDKSGIHTVEGKTHRIYVKINPTSEVDMRVGFKITSINLSPEEYSLSRNDFFAPAGSSAVYLDLTLKHDEVYKSQPKKLIFTIIPSDGYTAEFNPTFSVTADNIDLQPTMQMEAPDQVFETNQDFDVEVDVTLNYPSGEDTFFTLVARSLEPGADGDLIVSPTPYVIPAGQTHLKVPIKVIGDSSDEETKKYELYFKDTTNVIHYFRGNVEGDRLPVITVIDDDPTPIASFSLSKNNILEGDADEPIIISVNLDRPSDKRPEVHLSKVVDSSFPDSGFSIEPQSFTFESGETEKTALLHIVDNNNLEFDKTLELKITCQDTNLCTASPATESIAVLEDEENPTVGFDFYPEQKLSIRESSENHRYKIYLTFDSTNIRKFPIEVPFEINLASVDTEDYSLKTPSPLIIEPNDYGAFIELEILADAFEEETEQMSITLTQGDANNNAKISQFGTLNISLFDENSGIDLRNPYSPIATFASIDQEVNENFGKVTTTINLEAKDSLWGVPYNVTGTAILEKNYTGLKEDILLFPAGVNSKSISFDTIHNNLYDRGYTVVLSLEPNDLVTLGSPPVHTVRIKNIDPKPVIEFSEVFQTIAEGDSSSDKQVNVKVSLTPASGIDTIFKLSLSGSAQLSSDYSEVSSTNQYTIPAGTTSMDLSFKLIGDNLNEPEETIILSFIAMEDATIGEKNTHTVNIVDNDSTYTLNWDSNVEHDVLNSGGGYKVFYSNTSAFEIDQLTKFVDVPNPNDGSTTPTTLTLDLPTAKYFFKVVAYSQFNPSGSKPSAEATTND